MSKGPRLIAYDIEASNLAADFGIVLCVGFKEIGKGKCKVLSILDYPGADLIAKERNLLKDVSKEMLNGDVWIGHFSTYYDLPFINTRLLYHRLPILPANNAAVDTWRTARNRLKLRNNRLVTISEFLGTKAEKNAIKPEQWLRALGGHRSSMNYIVEHCRRDVVVLEEVYRRLRPLMLDHPYVGNVGKKGSCPACGSKKLQSRGTRRTKTRVYQRFQCQGCGYWPSSAQPVEKAERV